MDLFPVSGPGFVSAARISVMGSKNSGWRQMGSKEEIFAPPHNPRTERLLA
jgi:hypothetical protein